RRPPPARWIRHCPRRVNTRPC
ncbi:hypothetical protein SM139_3382, partial [Stenotrophomonas maltophilia]